MMPVAASPDSATASRPRPTKYRAFISYSHAAQATLAPVLQSALQKFAKPFYRLRAIRVFRDETSLALTPTLWPTIQSALADSDYFILMASPAAAASAWVQKEVSEWLSLNGGSADKLLIVLAAGALAWDNVANDFDWARTTALPPNLRGTFLAEPLFLDFTWATDRSQLSSRNPQFLRGVARLAATLRDTPLDAMIGEDVRQHRITRIVISIVAVLLVALGIATIIAAYVAMTQRDAAVREARIALAGQLAARSQVAYGQNGDLLERGVLLAVESARLIPEGSFDTDMALRYGISLLPTSRIRVPEAYNIFALAVSPDGVHAAVAAGPTVDVFEVATGRVVQRLTHQNTAFAVAFTGNGSHVLTSDGDVRVWRVADGAVDGTFESVGFVSRLVVSPNGERLAAVADNSATMFDLSTRRRLYTVTHDRDLGSSSFSRSINQLAFSPDSASFATAANDDTVRVWNASTGQAVARADYEDDVRDVAYSHDGSLIVTAGSDLTARVLDASSGEERARLSHSGPVTAVAFSPDDTYVATAGSEAVGGRNIGNTTEFFDHRDVSAHVWRVDDGREVTRLPHQGTVWALAFSPDGRQLATGSADRTARLWDVSSGSEVTRMVHAGSVTRVAFTPSGQDVLTGIETDVDGKTEAYAGAWSTADPRHAGRLRHPAGETVRALAFDSTRRYVATATSGVAVRLFDWLTGAEAHLVFHTGSATAVAFSPNGAYLALGFSRGIDLTPAGPALRDGATVLVVKRTPEGIIPPFDTWVAFTHGSTVEQLAYTPDGKRLVTRGDDRTVRIWDVAAKREIAQLRHEAPVAAFAITPDGSTVATAAGRNAALWSTGTGAVKGRTPHDGGVVGVAFGPDGKTLATVTTAGVVHVSSLSGPVLWEARHSAKPSAVTFNPSGTYVAVAFDDAVVLFDAHTGTARAELRHEARIMSMATTGDGAFIATTALDRTTRVWKSADGREVIRFAAGVSSALLGFDPTGKYLLVGSEGGVERRLWRTSDMVTEACAHLTRNLNPEEWRRFRPDAPYTATCSGTGTHSSTVSR